MADAFDRLGGTSSSSAAPSAGGGGDAFDRISAAPVAKKKSLSFAQKAVGVGAKGLSTVLDVLGRPGEAVLSAGRAGAENRDKGVANDLGAIAGGAWRGFSGKEHLTPTEAVLGRGVTAEQAYGKAGSVKGVLGRAADLGLAITSDPTTIMTGGSKEAAAAGARALEDTAAKQVAELGGRAELADMARQTIRQTAEKQGLKAALQKVGGKDVVKQTLKETALREGTLPRRSLSQVLTLASKSPEAAAERYANRALKELGRHGGLPETALGRATIDTEKAATAKLGKVAADVGKTAPVRAVDRVFHSNAGLRQEYGKDVAKAYKAAGVRRDAEILRKTQDFNARTDAALRLAGKVAKDGEKSVQAALERADGREWLAGRDEKLLPVFDAMHGIRKEITSGQVFSGAAKADQLHNVETYAPRTITPEFSKAMKDRENQAKVLRFSKRPNEAAQTLLQGGALSPRTLFPDKTVAQINAEITPKLQELGVLKKGEKIFKEEAVTPMLERAKKANEAIATQHYVDDLKNIKTADGIPLVRELKDITDSRTVKPGYEALQLSNGRKIVAPKEVIADLRGIEALTTNSQDLKAFSRAMQTWTRMWKQGATTLPISGSFTARNARSNFFLNYLGGVKDPRDYTDAFKIQGLVHKALKSKDNAEDLVAGKIDDVLKRSLGDSNYRFYREAQQHDVIGSTFSHVDLAAGTRKTGSKNPWTRAAHAGATANQAVEENARLAHFIAKRRQGATAEEAATSVKKYLFDYGDLSDIEKHKLKPIMPFYTFMRKNTPLQIEQLFKQPGKYTMRAHVSDAVTGTPDQENTPPWLRGGRTVPPTIQKALGIAADSIGITTPDNPLAAAEDQGIRPITEPLSMIPGIQNAIPKGYRADNKAQVGRTLAAIPSGPQIQALKYLTEIATNKNLFSGGNLKPGTRAEFDHALSAITPAYSRGSSVWKGLTDEQKRKAAILQMLTGIKITPVEK